MLIPLKVDVPMARLPLVNYALMAVIITVSFMGFADEKMMDRLSGVGGFEIQGLSEDQLETMTEKQFEKELRSGRISVKYRVSTKDHSLPVLAVTSTFLHADWLHLAGNMLFLWVFGNAVNYKLGHPLYLGVYLLCGLAGSMAHYLIQGGPVVGASGAINGMMGAFLVFFPLNNVKMFYWIWLRTGTFELSGIWVIILFVGWDLLFLVLPAQTSTALWAHVGGFAVGFSIALTLLLTKRIKPAADERTILYMVGKEDQPRQPSPGRPGRFTWPR